MVEAEAYYMVKGTAPLSSTLHPSLTGVLLSQDRAGSLKKMFIYCLLGTLGIKRNLGGTESVSYQRPKLRRQGRMRVGVRNVSCSFPHKHT